jgi:serine/threonine protein kinase
MHPDVSAELQLPPALLDRFELLEVVGRGGMGKTYRARDLQTDTFVAIKSLDFLKLNDWKDVELFEREAAVLRSLDHRSIPSYVDIHKDEVDIDGAPDNKPEGLRMLLLFNEAVLELTDDKLVFGREFCGRRWLGSHRIPFNEIRDVRYIEKSSKAIERLVIRSDETTYEHLTRVKPAEGRWVVDLVHKALRWETPTAELEKTP